MVRDIRFLRSCHCSLLLHGLFDLLDAPDAEAKSAILYRISAVSVHCTILIPAHPALRALPSKPFRLGQDKTNCRH